MKSGIYTITSSVTGKIYVGKAYDVIPRIKRHIRELNQGHHHNKHLQAAWVSDGPAAFSFEVLETCEIKDLLERESFYIRKFDSSSNGFNILTDKNTFEGLKHSEETKIRMRQKRLEFYERNPDHKQKLSRVRKEEWATGQRTNEQNQGRVLSEETKRKISNINKQKFLDGKCTLTKDIADKGRLIAQENRRLNPDKYRKISDEQIQSLQIAFQNKGLEKAYAFYNRLGQEFGISPEVVRKIVHGRYRKGK